MSAAELIAAEQRQRVLSQAQRWLGTPYHHNARVLGAGVDCAMLVAEVFEAAGLIEHVDPAYPSDWHQNNSQELYVEWLERCGAVEISGPPLPGDVAVWKFGRTHSHGAIVINWPVVLQAYIHRSVELASALDEPLASRDVRFFSMVGGAQ